MWSENTFPHSSGIASSASAFSSIALCLVDIGKSVYHNMLSEDDFYRKASFLARLGSGSAARSVYTGIVLWGEESSVPGSSDEIAIPLNDQIHPLFQNYNDVVLLIDDHPKKVSSSLGHAFMKNNPFSADRFMQARTNLQKLLKAMKEGDIPQFIEIVEYEALSLHAMMLTSYPGYFLLKPASLAIIEKIQHYRDNTGVPLCFTLDAGANVHVLFPDSVGHQVIEFIDREAKSLCKNEEYFIDHVGKGPAPYPAV
jgi:diphosphomevalonate decarboxylase